MYQSQIQWYKILHQRSFLHNCHFPQCKLLMLKNSNKIRLFKMWNRETSIYLRRTKICHKKTNKIPKWQNKLTNLRFYCHKKPLFQMSQEYQVLIKNNLTSLNTRQLSFLKILSRKENLLITSARSSSLKKRGMSCLNSVKNTIQSSPKLNYRLCQRLRLI